MSVRGRFTGPLCRWIVAGACITAPADRDVESSCIETGGRIRWPSDPYDLCMANWN
jgi:hypothetical protein